MTDIVEQARRRAETLEALSLVDVPPQDKASMSWQVESVLAMRQAVRDNVTMANEIEHLRFSLSEARATGRREGMETQLKAHMADDYGCGPAGMSKADVDRTIAHNATVRAEAAEARIAELEKEKHAALTMIAMLEKRLAKADVAIEPFADGRAKTTHANGCRYHGGHDCDCGKDDYLRAARAYMEGK